jgi:Na+/melibiose symporter-like transporter
MQSLSQVSMASSSIQWRPTAALAGVNASITLSWIIYRIHLAGLLTQAGFPKSFAPLLLLIESILAIGIEPWAGSTSDRTIRYLGGRFYVIWIGVGLTALLFVCLPGIVAQLPQNNAGNWWFPGLLIVWAVAISMFRSPALALLGNYASSKQLPAAASLVTLAGALAGSATPLATPWLLGLGTTATFVAAAVLLLASVGWLKAVQPAAPPVAMNLVNLHSAASSRISDLLRVFGLGLTVTLAFRLAVELFPKILKAQVAGVQPPIVMGVLFISMAIGALLAGRLATRWTNFKAMCLGLGLTAAFLILMLLTRHSSTAFSVAAALGVSFGIVFNGTLPFIFNNIAVQQAGLGVGLFFAGAATASSLYGGFLNQPGLLLPGGVGLGVGALLMASLCIATGRSTSQQNVSENV